MEIVVEGIEIYLQHGISGFGHLVSNSGLGIYFKKLQLIIFMKKVHCGIRSWVPHWETQPRLVFAVVLQFCPSLLLCNMRPGLKARILRSLPKVPERRFSPFDNCNWRGY